MNPHDADHLADWLRERPARDEVEPQDRATRGRVSPYSEDNDPWAAGPLTPAF